MNRKPKRQNIAKLLGVLVIALALLVTTAAILNPYFERRIYKLEYPQEIKQYAAHYSLDPYFVAAVIHCESSNKSVAVSEKGAIGLIAFMPSFCIAFFASALRYSLSRKGAIDSKSRSPRFAYSSSAI